jgi:hypothetical protein
MSLFDRLFAIDPLSPINHLVAGVCYLQSPERRTVGMDCVRRAWEMGLELPWTRLWVGYAQAFNGKTEAAIQELEDALEEGMPDPTAPVTRFFLEAFRGDREQALAALDPDARDYAWNDPDFPFLCAGMFAIIDEKEAALEWIQHALDRGNINYPLFASEDPFLEGLRGDVRFERLMAELKPKWEAFEF